MSGKKWPEDMWQRQQEQLQLSADELAYLDVFVASRPAEGMGMMQLVCNGDPVGSPLPEATVVGWPRFGWISWARINFNS